MESQHHIAAAPTADHIDFNKLKIIVRNNWLLLVLMFTVINAAVYLVIRYTKNTYQSESELKLDVKTNATELGIKSFVDDQNVNIVSGEIEIILLPPIESEGKDVMELLRKTRGAIASEFRRGDGETR